MEYKFKTNLNCGSCVNRVRPLVDEVEGLEKWTVDTADTRKILTIQVKDEAAAEAVKEAVEDAGFDIEPLEQA